MGIGDELRFDLFSVKRVPESNDYVVVRLVSNVSLIFAAIMAGIETHDFEQSVIHTGWIGSCPDWHRNMPIVTVPSGDMLGVDHLEFMLDSIESIDSMH